MFKVGRLHFFRDSVLFISHRPLSKNYGKGQSLFENIDVEHVVSILKTDGLYLGINLPGNILQKLLNFCLNTSYIGNGNPRFSFYLAEKEKEEIKAGEKFITASAINYSLIYPTIKQLENDPKLQEIAAKYLATDPVLIGSKIWWTFGIKKEAVIASMQGIYCFHYDLEDYRCLKFMFYLTDVDLFSGAHVCVKGSHNQKKLRDQLTLFRDRSDKDIIDYYGSANVINICGSAGFGFAEEPLCFHKGTIPVRSNRLLLEVKFASNNYNFDPNNYRL